VTSNLTTDTTGGVNHVLDLEALALPDQEYISLTNEELLNEWQNLYDVEARPMEGILGVVEYHDQRPDAVLSVDLCDVLRDTCRDYRRAAGLSDIRTHDYQYGVEANGLDICTAVVQRLMNRGEVAAVEEVADIANILRAIRAAGALVIANTSTLIGCESATIDERFMATHLRGCFDGIVFPRNHDGTGPISKAIAAAMVMEQEGIDTETTPVVHIDDAPHHVRSFRDYFTSNPRLALFMPPHEGNQHEIDLQQYLVQNALEAFKAASRHIAHYTEDYHE
jgi:hypothetical protein